MKENINHLLSFLAIIVDRNGGELKIDNLSEYANRNITIQAKPEGDSIILTTKEA